MEKIKNFLNKHKQLILYSFFGVTTTILSFAAWYITMELGVLIWHDDKGEPTWGLDIAGSTVQWVVGVITAFISNKKWVFVDADKGVRVTIRQFISFTCSRLLTFFIETFLNLGLIEVFVRLGYKSFHLDIFKYEFDVTERIWAKILTAVAVVVINYVMSKLVVFRQPKKKGENKDKIASKK